MDRVVDIFKQGFANGHFLRIGSKALRLFVGMDEEGLHCFEFRGVFSPSKILGSAPLRINQYKGEAVTNILRFSLLRAELDGCFCAFCEDLASAVANVPKEEDAYKVLVARHHAWQELFKSSGRALSEQEVMGLIGELLFLRDCAIPQWGASQALESWTGPSKAHKDFSYGEDWYEVKTVSKGNQSVRISSIEQLDSTANGTLCVYPLERMSATYHGLTVNILTTDILNTLTEVERDMFLHKLSLWGFDFNPAYDGLVYAQPSIQSYRVDAFFPRLRRDSIPCAITNVQYELLLPEIETFKNQT